MIPIAVLDSTAELIVRYAGEYHGEVPTRLHGRDLDRGGAPGWHPGFSAWLTGGLRPAMDQVEPDRMRITRALRTLRKVAPREHDVIYRVLVLGHDPEQICAWLNARSIFQGHPERYSLRDTVVLIVSGIDKMSTWQ